MVVIFIGNGLRGERRNRRMKRIQDEVLLNSYLERYQIKKIFDTKELPFQLYQYDKGEILNNIHNASAFLQFVVEGTIRIYSVREDGGYYPVCLVDEFTLFGDVEFCEEVSLPMVVEATRCVTCVEIPLYECREVLLRDNTFLRFLLHSVVHKMALFVRSEASFSSLEEKLLHYMQAECPGQCFQGVEKTASRLRCSRRQLQRLLKSLMEQNLIEKTGKGKYRLVYIDDI